MLFIKPFTVCIYSYGYKRSINAKSFSDMTFFSDKMENYSFGISRYNSETMVFCPSLYK